MFRIRRIYDDLIPLNRLIIAQIQEILRQQFPLLSEEEIRKLPEQLRNPLKFRFRSVLFVAEGARAGVKGFALLHHAPDLNFSFLDFIAAARHLTGGGFGSALYERVREEALSLKGIGLFFECLPDAPELCRDEAILKQNAARLRFYERYGARPLINTAYETPVNPDDDCPPYLVFDNLGKSTALERDRAKRIVRAILQRKYGDLCPREYINRVVRSIKDDPLRLREPRYVKKRPVLPVRPVRSVEKSIVLAVNDKHDIHHVRERGYLESPVRIGAILREIEPTELFEKIGIHHFSERYIKAVHEGRYVDYFKKVCTVIKPGTSVYPYVFPIRNMARPPKELPVRAGYYCIDTFTPLNRNAYLAARRAVDCALAAAEQIIGGYRLAYALVRPPGHHAERCSFGGFCYFNSAAVAADYLSAYGKIAMLDIDYHHGNGSQVIFYERSDVLTVSIHGHPSFAYPYFSGFADEKGEGTGKGYNVNIPLPEKLDGDGYRKVLADALKRLARFSPRFLVVSLGLDTAREDPTGTWSLEAKDFEAIGKMIGSLHLPTLVVQEGGYDTRVLGINARHFFSGLWSGCYS